MPGAADRVKPDAVKSADGTLVAYDVYGEGPAVVLVQGAFSDRRHPLMTAIAGGLARWFTVHNYDRRGRGDSGDVQPYAVEREIEDLAAVVEAAGGSAMVFGGSSGAALALEAAAVNPSITKLAVWEPPYHVDDSAPALPLDFAEQLADLVVSGRRDEAVERFMVEAAELPREAVAGMRAHPAWAEMEAVAHTLAYEAAVLGPGNALPAARLSRIAQPTLVLNGADSAAWMANAGVAVAAAVPGAVRRVLEDQAHNVAPEALVPELLEFFVTA
ncbi:alpha/beta fold hydrolase [Nonomuraea gerenzanensis]|uniref:alpha/beta fold hydrolase n=1 Tax=Nonomuraea gerenzanensis TaxID=93944 RepID=UPI001CD9802C|nr:alpha/beta hydrolase [Nonomuraea gerenzanensis]UBU16719.1 alpha/beta hydrolase [Nonomuraea gerenzanensis]